MKPLKSVPLRDFGIQEITSALEFMLKFVSYQALPLLLPEVLFERKEDITTCPGLMFLKIVKVYLV